MILAMALLRRSDPLAALFLETRTRLATLEVARVSSRDLGPI
jgi:hypothetical protein